MPFQRPASAPVRPNELKAPVERLLKLDELLKEEHVPQISEWWVQLPIVGRSRGRWVFVEPPGLGFPRQRARREFLSDDINLDDLDLPEETAVERHNKSQHFKPVKGVALTHWKDFCLKTTNQEFQKVPEPDMLFGPAVWMRTFRKSHGGLLRPGALEKIEAWQPESTQRQRAALSELLWSFNTHLTAKRGRTETKIQYGPKQGDVATVSLIDPFGSALGREMRAERKARPKSAVNAKRDVGTLSSSVPIKWAGGNIGKLESSNQAQMRTVKPKDLADAIKWGKPGYACRPPATSGMGRHLGGPEWHGDAMYGKFWPAATKTFQPLSEQRRPWHIPGHDKLKRDLA